MDTYGWQEIIFGVLLFMGLAYGAYRFIAPRLNKGGGSGGIGGKGPGNGSRRH